MKPLNPTVKVPTKAYLKKFVLTEIGDKPIAPGDHPVQKFLFILLERKLYDYQFKSLNAQFNDTLLVKISLSNFHKMGYSISPQRVVLFNNFIESLFDKALYGFVSQYVRHQDEMQAAIQKVLDEYNIKPRREHQRNWFQVPRYKDALYAFAKKYNLEMEEDVTYELLKKMEYRARKKFESEKTISQSVPSIIPNNINFNLS